MTRCKLQTIFKRRTGFQGEIPEVTFNFERKGTNGRAIWSDLIFFDTNMCMYCMIHVHALCGVYRSRWMIRMGSSKWVRERERERERERKNVVFFGCAKSGRDNAPGPEDKVREVVFLLYSME
ncbi:hypothetical protein TWF706_003309 [Orbilia oligospora]|nr:hypothetical protein TWF706_003309 [Orbilia oligospora]